MKVIKKNSHVKLVRDISLQNGLILYKGEKFCVVKKDRHNVCELVSGEWGDGWHTGIKIKLGIDCLELV